ncbi:MAG: pilus assembly protein PilO [Scytonema sp. PMC 1069.18]|nr:pilus assembly protein PilO [Scytonema sp. PMC 1069.18]MEC4887950.1 pilus assembly protein PilO [Scytonema sp. PMC 1070.18]
MTLSEDLSIQGGEFDTPASSYPVLFGITLTPQVSGIILGVLGLGGTLFMVMNMVMPAWDTFQQQQTKQSELQGEVEQRKANIKQIDQVKQEQVQAKQQQVQVLGLFANEKTLDTLPLDINRLVESGNVQVPPNAVRAKLKKFAPASTKAEPITDGSFGTLVDGKLKRSSINIEIVGTYEQTQSILRNIERLQPLLIVKDYQSSLAPEPTPEPGKVPRRIGPAPISTTFQLQALMPLSPQEAAAATPKQ